jgi:hypothetical protein
MNAIEVVLARLGVLERGSPGQYDEHREDARVFHPAEAESDSEDRRESQQASDPQQPEHPQALEHRREERGRQDHDRDAQRVVDQVPASVGDDGEHRDKLAEEREPDCPVESAGNRLSCLVDIGALQDQGRNDERGGNEHRPLKPPLKLFAALAQPWAVPPGGHGLRFVASPRVPAAHPGFDTGRRDDGMSGC